MKDIEDAESSGIDLDRRQLLKYMAAGAVALGVMSTMHIPFARAQDMSNGANNFYTSDLVTTQKVAFPSQYKMNVAGNLFVLKEHDAAARLPAIVVGHPMGAVKEQSANFYATKMAEQGFVTLSINLPFWGESEGDARQIVSPDVYAEAFSTAKINPHMKAIATVSMYDMGAANRIVLIH